MLISILGLNPATNVVAVPISGMIDLRSDTVTTPSAQMREAARDAAVGDDVYKEDPTVKQLQTAVADRLGFEAALYVPSGTMGNQVAVRTHTERGQEILLDEESHIYKWELGGIAQLSGLQSRTIDAGPRGVPTPEQVQEYHVSQSLHRPGTGLLCLENTHNSRGGLAIAPDRIDAAAQAAHDLGVPVHLDGARLFNAAVVHDVPAKRFTEHVDSVSLCLSKGLGAPVGSVIAGSESFIDQARRNRKLFGGGMRQVGIIAAPALVALENIDRLATDHANAQRLAAGLADLPGLSVTEPETNIVLVETTALEWDAEEFLSKCHQVDVLGTEYGSQTVRFCTHLDVDRSDIDTAIERIRSLFD